MDAVIGAEVERALQVGSGKAVIHRQFGACLVGDVGDGRDVADGEQRVGWGFKEEEFGVRADGVFPFVKVGHFDEGGFDAVFGEGFAEHVEDGAEAVARADDVVARFEFGKAEGEDGAHAACGRGAARAAFKRRHARFEELHGGVAEAAVLVGGFAFGEDVGGLLGAREGEG